MPPPSSPDSSRNVRPPQLPPADLNRLNELSDFLLRNRLAVDDRRRRRSSGRFRRPYLSSLPIQIRNISADTFVEENDSSDMQLHDNMGDSDDSNETDYDAHLRSDIRSSERLLLSLARQNFTNRNTLIHLENDTSNEAERRQDRRLSGVPLRRQNAIRRKRQKSTEHHTALLRLLSHELLAEYTATIKAIRSLLTFRGKLPLFRDHSYDREMRVDSADNSPNLACSSTPKNDPLDLSSYLPSDLDLLMDRFLQKRRAEVLWIPQSRNSKVTKTIEKENSGKKRRSRVPIETVSKRQKMAVLSDPEPQTSLMNVSYTTGERVSSEYMTSAQKSRIMDVLPTSFLRDGGCFRLSLGENTVYDVSFSSVDYAQKRVHGRFLVPYSFVDEFSPLNHFRDYLLGVCDGIGPRNENLAQKDELLRDLMSSNTFRSQLGEFSVPFFGKIVDFKESDLRFLPPSSVPKSAIHGARNVHLSLVRAERVRLQLLEWMRLQPFEQFSEAFFLNHLQYIEQHLETFDQQTDCARANTVEIATNVKTNIHALCRGFPFIRLRDQPIPMIENEKNRKHRKGAFLTDWDKRLCNKLTEFVTCEQDCLLNIQLNYLLFTVRVNVTQFLNRYIEMVINLLHSEEHRTRMSDKFAKFRQQEKPSSADECIILCSLNRKTGQLEMHNTRACLNHKNVYGDSHSLPMRRRPGVSLSDEMNISFDSFFSPEDSSDEGEDRLSSGFGSSSIFDTREPYNDEQTTLSTGFLKKGLGTGTYRLV